MLTTLVLAMSTATVTPVDSPLLYEWHNGKRYPNHACSREFDSHGRSYIRCQSFEGNEGDLWHNTNRKVRRQFHNSCSLKGRIGGTCMNVETPEETLGSFQEAQYSTNRRSSHQFKSDMRKLRQRSYTPRGAFGKIKLENPKETVKPWQEARKAKCRALTVGLRCAG